MKNKPLRGALTVTLCALICLCALPRAARAAGEDVSDSAAFNLALANSNVDQINLLSDVTLSGTSIRSGVTILMNGHTVTGPGGATVAVNGVISGSGTLDMDDVQNGGSIGGAVLVTGALREQTTFPTVTGGISTITYNQGTKETAVQGGSGYWVAVKYNGSGVSVKAVTTTAGKTYRLGTDNPVLSEVFSISYINEDQTVAYTDNPTAYTLNDAPFTLSDPAAKSMLGYTFKGWATTGGYQKNLVVDPASLTGDVIFYAAWEQAPAGAGTAAGKTGGVAGGGSGTFSTSGALTAATDDDDDDDTAAATATASSGFGNMRVRMASSTTRHTVHSDQETDVQALANQKTAKSRFPWQWLGAGLGGALLLTALGVTLKRRAEEKTAAMLEKLHIKD